VELLERVQAWLVTRKLELLEVDPALELHAKDMVFGKLAQSYDVTGWLSSATTPSLVQNIMAMLIAAWTYEIAYSNDSGDVQAYTLWLERKANDLMAGIISGAIDIIEVIGRPETEFSNIDFWPNDSTEILCPDAAAKFTVSKVF
jgi:hypothetical protein